MLDSAIKFLKKSGIKFDYVNENFKDVNFKTSRKIFYDILIDDRNIYGEIDWLKFKEIIKKKLIEAQANEIYGLYISK